MVHTLCVFLLQGNPGKAGIQDMELEQDIPGMLGMSDMLDIQDRVMEQDTPDKSDKVPVGDKLGKVVVPDREVA